MIIAVSLVESSFCFKLLENKVRVFREYELREGDFEKYLKTANKGAKFLSKKTGKKHEVFVCRAGSKKCPIKINWNNYYKMKKELKHKMSKYDIRNLDFVLKDKEWEKF